MVIGDSITPKVMLVIHQGTAIDKLSDYGDDVGRANQGQDRQSRSDQVAELLDAVIFGVGDVKTVKPPGTAETRWI